MCLCVCVCVCAIRRRKKENRKSSKNANQSTTQQHLYTQNVIHDYYKYTIPCQAYTTHKVLKYTHTHSYNTMIDTKPNFQYIHSLGKLLCRFTNYFVFFLDSIRSCFILFKFLLISSQRRMA